MQLLRLLIALGLLLGARVVYAAPISCSVSGLSSAAASGGDWELPDDCTIYVQFSDFTNYGDPNSSFGQTLWRFRQQTTISGNRVQIINNSGSQGHAIVVDPFNFDVPVVFDGLSFYNFNPPTCCASFAYYGAAIAATQNTNLTVRNGHFNNNSGSSSLFAQGQLTVSNSSFISNNGYGVEVESTAAVDISNSTFYGNSGAGIRLGNFATASIVHNTLVNQQNGIYSVSGSNMIVRNNLFANNFSGDCGGFSPMTMSGNLSNSGFHNCNPGPGVSFGYSPPQPENGSIVQYIALTTQDVLNAVNGPAAAFCLGTDARGRPRRGNVVCDAGAWEAQPYRIDRNSDPFATTALTNTAFPNPLELWVRDQNNNYLGGVNVQLTGPASGASIAPSNQNLRTNGPTSTPSDIVASFPIVANAIQGSYSLSATFTGNTQGAATVNVENVTPAVTLSSITASPSPVVRTLNFTVGVTVTKNSPLGPEPTGSLAFKIGATTLCTAILPSTSCNATYPTAGTYTITVDYSGGAPYAATSTSRTNAINVVAASLNPTVQLASPSTVVRTEPFTVSTTINKSPATTPDPTGTLTFKIGATTLCTTTLPTLSCSTTYDTTGSQSVIVEYAGNTYYGAATNTRAAAVNVITATTTTTLMGASTNRLGETNVVMVSVASPNTSAVPSGTIDCRLGADSVGMATLVDGQAMCTFAADTIGSYTINVVYTPDTTKFATSSKSLGWMVQKQTATVAISGHNPDPSPTNTPVTIEVTATANGGSFIPTGMVTISDGLNGCIVTLDASGHGSCVVSFATEGVKSLTASYPGDANFDATTGEVIAHTVGQASTSVELVSLLPSPAYIGDPVTITARVVKQSGVTAPTGTLRIDDGGGRSCMETLGAELSLTCTFDYATSYSGVLTLSYSGDSSYKASTTTIDPYNVLAINKVTMESSLNPAPFGAAVTIAIKAQTEVLTPSGFVLVNGGGMSHKVPLTAGVGSLALNGLPVGTLTLEGVYSADGMAVTLVTGSLVQIVSKASTTLTLATNRSPAYVGEPVVLTARLAVVAPGGGTPTGMVRFSVGDTELGTAPLEAGFATLTTRAIPEGSNAIVAEYVGDGSFESAFGTLPGEGQQLIVAHLAVGCAVGGTSASGAELALLVGFAVAVVSRRRRPARAAAK